MGGSELARLKQQAWKTMDPDDMDVLADWFLDHGEEKSSARWRDGAWRVRELDAWLQKDWQVEISRTWAIARLEPAYHVKVARKITVWPLELEWYTLSDWQHYIYTSPIATQTSRVWKTSRAWVRRSLRFWDDCRVEFKLRQERENLFSVIGNLTGPERRMLGRISGCRSGIISAYGYMRLPDIEHFWKLLDQLGYHTRPDTKGIK